MSTRQGIVGIVALAVCAVALALCFERGHAAPTSRPAAVQRHDGDGVRERTPPPDRAVVSASAPAGTDAGPTITVRVLLQDGTPAVGALLRVGPVRGFPNRRPLDGESDWPSFPTDGDAIGLLPWPVRELGDVTITGRHGAQWGSLTLSASTRDGSAHTLRLADDCTLVVRAVDREGAPVAGVDVELLGPPLRLTAEAEIALAAETTGANGEAVFAHARQWASEIESREGVRPLRVRSGGLVRSQPIELDANALPEVPVVLQLDDFGVIEVTALEADGARMERGLVVVSAGDRFSVQHAEGAMLRFVAAVSGERHRVSIPLASGEPMDVEGPAAAGEVVAVTVRATPEFVVTGRLVRNGDPLVGVRVAVTTTSLPLPVAHPTATSDDEGRFRIRLHRPGVWFHDGAEAAFHLWTLDEARQATGLSARWRGPAPKTDTFDLGTLTMRTFDELPLLVAGRIRVPGSLDGVYVWIGRVGHEALGPLEPHPDVLRRTDGSFEMRGEVENGSDLQLCVQSRHLMPVAPVPFRIGQSDIDVVLRERFERTVTFRLPSRDMAMALRPVFRVRPDDADDDPHDVPPDDRSWDGERLICCWRFASEHRCDLLVLGQGRTPLRVIPDVRFGPDAPPDPRLVDVELPALRPLRITVPAPPPWPRLQWSPTEVTVLDGDTGIDSAAELDPRTFLLLAEGPIDVRVRVPGFRDRVVRGMRQDTTVELERGVPVTLKATLDGVPPDAATLQVHGDDSLFSVGVLGGEAVLWLPAAGRYTLSAETAASVLRVEPAEIEVHENGGIFAVRLLPQ